MIGGKYAATAPAACGNAGAATETAAEINPMERDGADSIVGMTGMPELVIRNSVWITPMLAVGGQCGSRSRRQFEWRVTG